MHEVAKREARRIDRGEVEEDREPLNPADAPAPSWVDELDA